MNCFKFFLIVIALGLVSGHTVFTTLFVNDVSQGDGTCVRMPMNPSTCTAPVIDLSSNDMACGVDGQNGVARVCPVSQDSKLSFIWREFADASHPGALDPSHKGPCAVYMKAVDSAIEDPGYGSGWFKIWDEGYDSVAALWCTEKLISNNGVLSVNVPQGLAGGYYLVRPELLALQEADKTLPQPQFYIGCAQIFLSSSGSSNPATVNIPGYVLAGEPSVTFNIWEPHFPYTLPGPAVYVPPNVSEIAQLQSAYPIQTEGLAPIGCILNNANWCGIELDSYNNEDGCWNASRNCWTQATDCYDSAPPTGSKGCKIWESKCSEIQSNCNAGIFNGPPHQDQNLNPSISTSLLPSEDSPAVAASVTLLKADLSLSIPGTVGTFESLVTDTFSELSSVSQLFITNGGSALLLSASTVFSALPSTSSTIRSTSTSLSSSTSSVSAHVSDAVTIDTSLTDPTISMTTKVHSQSPTSLDLPVSASIIAQNSPMKTSENATCGPESEQTCLGSVWGDCCSQWGWCGSIIAYCGDGCQAGYGKCNLSKATKMKRSRKQHSDRHRHVHRLHQH